MFVHLVLIKLKPGVARSDPRVRAWEDAFKALPQHYTGIVRFEYGWNTTDRPIAYDFVVSTWRLPRAPISTPTVRIPSIRRSWRWSAKLRTGSSAITRLPGE